MSRVVVEREFEEPVCSDELEGMVENTRWCMELYGIKRLESLVSLDGRRAICIYEAPDLEAVRKANETGELPYVRIWSANVMP